MRITSRMLVDQSLRRMETQHGRLADQQERISSGRQIRRSSDDPAGAGRILRLQADMRAREQESRNAADAATQLNLADSALQSVVSRLHRARDLTVAGANVQQDGARAGMASEIAGIRDEVLAVANSRHSGRPLFSGFADTAAVAKVAGTWTYQGDTGQQLRRVGEGDVVVANVTGDEVFGFASGGDLFTLLDNVEAAMIAGDQNALSSSLAALDTALATIGDAQAKIGSAANRVESAQTRNLDAQLAIRTEQSEVQDTNMAEAIMELQLQEMAYQATLQVVGRSLPDSLASFIR